MADIFITPDEWNIKIEKKGNRAKMVCEEFFYRKGISKEQWNAIIDLNLSRSSGNIRGMGRTDDEFYICLKFEEEFKDIATMIVREFLPYSEARDVTFSEVKQCAILGMPIIVKLGKTVERKVKGEGGEVNG